MSAVGLIIAIALPVALILMGLVYAGRRQQQNHVKRLQAKAIRQRADDLVEALDFLIQVDNHKEIQTLMLERAAYLYERYRQQLPAAEQGDDSNEDLDVEHYKQQIESSKSHHRVLKSDREIRYAKAQFSQVLKTLGPMVKSKVISEAAAMEYRRYLRLTLLEKEVDTFTAQGDLAAQRGDAVTAISYFKAAKKLLIECDLQYPEKNERIRALTQRTSNLYHGQKYEAEDNLAKELSKENAPQQDEFGIPLDPNAGVKKRF
jgi:coenzyme F420-reducing hydrogenase alpha subunit